MVPSWLLSHEEEGGACSENHALCVWFGHNKDRILYSAFLRVSGNFKSVRLTA